MLSNGTIDGFILSVSEAKNWHFTQIINDGTPIVCLMQQGRLR
jgi:hypothetical protein